MGEVMSLGNAAAGVGVAAASTGGEAGDRIKMEVEEGEEQGDNDREEGEEKLEDELELEDILRSCTDTNQGKTDSVMASNSGMYSLCSGQ